MKISRIDKQPGQIHRMLAYPAIGAAMAFSTFSYAGFDLDFSNEDWPAVEVTGANGVYTQMVGISHPWQADMHLDPSGDSKVISWKFWPTVSNTQDLVAGKPVGPDLKSALDEDSYPWGKRPYSVNETIGGIMTSELNSWSVKQCNDLVQFLKDAGLDANEIHGIDRVLAVEWRLRGVVSVYNPTPLGGSFGSGEPSSFPMQSTITCKSITPPVEVVGSDDISLPAPDFELIDTDLTVFYTASQQCPKDILVSSNTRTNIQGQFRLWYEIQSANAGSLKSNDYTVGTGVTGDAGIGRNTAFRYLPGAVDRPVRQRWWPDRGAGFRHYGHAAGRWRRRPR